MQYINRYHYLTKNIYIFKIKKKKIKTKEDILKRQKRKKKTENYQNKL